MELAPAHLMPTLRLACARATNCVPESPFRRLKSTWLGKHRCL
jgi:hypothetical protein